MNIEATVVYEKNRNSDKKIVINRWWTRSSKSWSLLQLVLTWLISWKIDNNKTFESWICSIARKYSSTITNTILRDWEELLVIQWLWFLLSEEHRNKSNRTYTYKGRMVEFIWADDQQKLRWAKRDILYCNEANELRYRDEFFQLMIRTTYKVFIDFNPDNEDIWINTELEQKRKNDEWDVDVIVSTYKDNPFLDENIVKEIERLEKIDPMYWRIYWLGEYWKMEWLVFTNWEEIWQVPDWSKLIGRWMDFGFTNDPTALIAVYRRNEWLILDEEIYKTWLTNQDIIKELQNLWISRSDEIFWDSAEPKSIEEIYRWGFNIKPVSKWPDSIRYWIDIMKSNKLYITSRSRNLIREFKGYIWTKDKNNNLTDKPIDSNNHGIDWCRYCCLMKLWKPRVVWVWSI
jgi:phage terminase large subunit